MSKFFNQNNQNRCKIQVGFKPTGQVYFLQNNYSHHKCQQQTGYQKFGAHNKDLEAKLEELNTKKGGIISTNISLIVKMTSLLKQEGRVMLTIIALNLEPFQELLKTQTK